MLRITSNMLIFAYVMSSRLIQMVKNKLKANFIRFENAKMVISKDQITSEATGRWSMEYVTSIVWMTLMRRCSFREQGTASMTTRTMPT